MTVEFVAIFVYQGLKYLLKIWIRNSHFCYSGVEINSVLLFVNTGVN